MHVSSKLEGLHPGESIEVLLIDDNADYLLLIRRALEHRDARYHVTGVSSPDDGLEMLRERAFDLVLLDYKFPRGGNGLQLIRALKNEATFVPTVMVTAFGDESLAIQAMREGALDFVPKTSDFIQALPDVAARAIERGRIIRDRIATQRALGLRNKELIGLAEAATTLNACSDREGVLGAVRAFMRDVFDATPVSEHVPEEEGEDLRARPARRSVAAVARDLPGDPAAARAERTGEVIVETDAAQDTLLTLPLVAHDRVLGAMTFRLRRGETVDAPERQLAAGIGQHAGIALERARLVHDLAATRHYLKDLIDNAGDEVIAVDTDGRIISWNAGAEAIYGWTRGEMIGRAWVQLWPPEREAEALDLFRRVLEQDDIVRNHDTIRWTKDGSRVDVMLTLTPLSNPDGSVHGISCLGKNLTQQKQLQAQLMQSEKMATVGHLISGVAHELNNPLTVVLGYAQLVCDADVGDRAPEYLRKISSEAQRVQRIVQNLLAFARKREPQAMRVDVNEVVRETFELASYDLRVCDIDVELNLTGGLPTTLADPYQLQQVFLNILTNARHALKDRAQRGHIRITTRHDDDALDGHPALVVELEDDGPGVPEALRQRVFDPFFTTKAAGEGTGLGLSLSYGIIQEHGGRIACEESEWGGALFRTCLPVLGAFETLERLTSEEAAAHHAADAKKRILVVDDQSAVRDMVRDALRLDGHDIEVAQDGNQALDKIVSGQPFDLIIADLLLPGFGGDRLYREVANIHPDFARRVVFSGADVTPESRRLLEGTGARYLAKPFGAAELRSTVSSFFGNPATQQVGRSESP